MVCAVICGFEGWDEIEDFGHSKLNFLRQYGNFTGGIPVNLLNVQSCLVTIDAMGCQKKIAASVLHKGANYLLSVKDNHRNQPKLVKAFEQAFPVSVSWFILKVMPT